MFSSNDTPDAAADTAPAAPAAPDAAIRVLTKLCRRMAVAEGGEAAVAEFAARRATRSYAERIGAVTGYAAERGYPIPPPTASVTAIEGMEFLSFSEAAAAAAAAEELLSAIFAD